MIKFYNLFYIIGIYKNWQTFLEFLRRLIFRPGVTRESSPTEGIPFVVDYVCLPKVEITDVFPRLALTCETCSKKIQQGNVVNNSLLISKKFN